MNQEQKKELAHVSSKGVALVETADELSEDTRRAVFSNANSFSNASIFPTDELYRQYSPGIMQIAKETMHGLKDLKDNKLGFVHKWQNTESAYIAVNDSTKAIVGMDIEHVSDDDRLTFEKRIVPVPIYSKNFTINGRYGQILKSSSFDQVGEMISNCARAIFEQQESTVFNGVPTIHQDGFTLEGYLNHPKRKTVNLTTPWTNITARTIVPDVLALLKEASENNRNSDFMLYVSNDVWHTLFYDYDPAKTEKSVLDKIKTIAGIKDVKPSRYVASNRLVLVHMNRMSVDFAFGDKKELAVIELPPINYLERRFLVHSVMTLRIKYDRNDQSGIIIGQA